VTTDTYDADGETVSSGGKTDFDRDAIASALASFVGRIQQVPPMYSAIKQGGRPLHELARQGRTVERDPRPVEIDSIELLDWSPPELSIEVVCSPGTYIRSLAHDLGERLGSGAHLSALVRLGSGHFDLSDATSLERLAEAFEHSQESQYLIALDEAFLDRPAAIVGAEAARRIAHGQAVDLHLSPGTEDDWERLARAYGPEGEFLAIMVHDPASGLWRPQKVFV
jgi:tRNA pseudouridine55 synthase